MPLPKHPNLYFPRYGRGLALVWKGLLILAIFILSHGNSLAQESILNNNNNVAVGDKRAPQNNITIDGPMEVCVGSLPSRYTISDRYGQNTTLTWNLSGGGTIVQGDGTDTIYIAWTSWGPSYKITVNEMSGAFSVGLDSLVVTVYNPPITPTVTIIADPNPVCSGGSVRFEANFIYGGGLDPEFSWFVNNDVVSFQNRNEFQYTPVNGDTVFAILKSSIPCLLRNDISTDTIIMQLNDISSPSITIKTPDTTLCTGESVTITDNVKFGGSSPIIWYVNGAPPPPTAVITDSTLTYPPGDGDWVYAMVDSSNYPCVIPPYRVRSDTLTFSLLTNPEVRLTIAQETERCYTDSVTIRTIPENAGTNPQYKWYRNNILIPGQQSEFYTGPLDKNDTVYAIVISTLNCAIPNNAKSDSIIITKPPPLGITNLATTPEYCNLGNGSVEITATGGTGAYQYTLQPANLSSSTPDFTSLREGTYTLTVTDVNGCDDEEIFSLLNMPAPSVTATGTLTYCTGETIILTAATTSTETTTYSWDVPSGPDLTVNPLTIPNASSSQSGNYSVTGIDPFGCPSTWTQTITVNPLPDVSLNAPPEPCEGDTVTLSPGTGYASYFWPIDNSTRPEFIATESGNYSVRVTDENNCSNTATTTLTFVSCADVYIPNAFAPGGPEPNNTFKPVKGGPELIDFTMIIFDRWGKEVCNTPDYITGWDGTTGKENKPAETGTYSYYISYRLARPPAGSLNQPQEKRGIVTLVRY